MKSFMIFINIILAGILIFSCKNHSQNNLQVTNDPIDLYFDSLRSAMLGKEFGNLVFTDSLNQQFDLKSLKGNVVAINIWAFGCKPCMEEMPKLNQLVNKYENQPVKFLSLIGAGEKLDFKDTAFVRLFKHIDFKYNTVRTDRGLNELFNFQFIFPQHIILDKKGLVMDYFAGPQTERLDSIINLYR